MKKYIFNAGPSLLPDAVLESCKDAIDDFKNSGISILSTGHRTAPWVETMEECRSLWRELLHIPSSHEVIFLSGGCTMQFLYAALNFLEHRAGYVDTGVWASKALLSAQEVGDAFAIASSADRGYTYIPRDFEVPDGLDYIHITSNNTIYGTEYHEDPDFGGVPLIADMSSDILSRQLDFSKYDLVYGGAQKNAGAAGVTFAIVRRDALGKVSRKLPFMLDYQKHIDKDSMLNTPPVFAIFVMNETLKWLKDHGGVEAAEIRCRNNAAKVYAELERNPLFYLPVEKEDRSYTNIRFVMAPGFEAYSEDFLAFAESRGIVGLRGHVLSGGFRASLYNACTSEHISALLSCLQDYSPDRA